MDTQSLLTFVTVTQLKSISLTAEHLHLTQPAVTKRIQLLEQQVNTRLFDRIGRKLFLTAAGSCLLPFANDILRLLAESKQALADLDGEVKGVLKLVTSHHIGLHRLPKVLQAYKKRYPQVKIQIEFMDSAEAHEAILQGKADIGVTTESVRLDTKIHATVIWADTLRFVVAKDHPLTKITKPRLAHIAQYPAILPGQKFYTAQVVTDLFSSQKLTITHEKGLSSNYLESIKALLSVGDTWSVLPESMLDKKLITALNPAGVNLSRKLVYISHQDRSLNKAGQMFVQLLDSVKTV
ncbi:MAG: LysR family transcriptional regulator [Pseudomonadota bacterium]